MKEMSWFRFPSFGVNSSLIRIAAILLAILMCFTIATQWISYSELSAVVIAKLTPVGDRYDGPASDLNYAYKYNLLDGVDDAFSRLAADHAECTLDYMNANKLAQDHPCVIDTIRRHYLHDPSPRSIPYNLTKSSMEDGFADQPELREYQSVQSPHILRLLKNQTEGFFLECGAADGRFLSNTLYMERSLNWTGVLIEANPHNYPKLLSRNRKAWTLPICLSTEPYPTQVSFVAGKAGVESAQAHIVEVDANGTIYQDKWDRPNQDSVTVQCFPLYSVLLAVNRTRLDFLALDIEGYELKVLETVPFHKVDIRTMTVEWLRMRDGGEKGAKLTKFLEESGFLYADVKDEAVAMADSLFFKDTLNDPGRRERST